MAAGTRRVPLVPHVIVRLPLQSSYLKREDNETPYKNNNLLEKLYSFKMLLFLKKQEPDFPPVFQGFLFKKGRVVLFFLANRGYFFGLQV
ncbi:hypothetical protein D3H55_09245 [Bacillus salacetis]|uniref:Uncharacterized protein n=1 Tax=Bacillus salacetis TaxID=2315464 RepID=A0A3A1QZG5_9BACI|nr:hypothetical protein [Bacillus salacetis]RIW34689.1 hypothetical protein D3H55_09245 [Bacillus salacetis]